jgi:hypothetical protein
MNKSVTLTSEEWETVEQCLRDLHLDHGYAIGSLRSKISLELEGQEL